MSERERKSEVIVCGLGGRVGAAPVLVGAAEGAGQQVGLAVVVGWPVVVDEVVVVRVAGLGVVILRRYEMVVLPILE